MVYPQTRHNSYPQGDEGYCALLYIVTKLRVSTHKRISTILWRSEGIIHVHTIADLLDAASVQLGDVSDYRLAKELKTSSQNVSRWRNGQVVPSNEIIVPLAQLIGIDPHYAIACMVLAKGDSNRDYWERQASFEHQAAAIRTVNALLEKTAAAYETKAREYLSLAERIRARTR